MAKSNFEVNVIKRIFQSYTVYVEASSVESAVRKATEMILQDKVGEPILETANVEVKQVYSEKTGEFIDI